MGRGDGGWWKRKSMLAHWRECSQTGYIKEILVIEGIFKVRVRGPLCRNYECSGVEQFPHSESPP